MGRRLRLQRSCMHASLNKDKHTSMWRNDTDELIRHLLFDKIGMVSFKEGHTKITNYNKL